ncbi:pectin lyase-like protein [Acephala macrosclerotiorum]|nr:pectin lyase-like protein [Acephala macrosclerotiorum]
MDFDSTSNECTVQAGPAGEDDPPAIIDAISMCGGGGSMNVLNTTHHIERTSHSLPIGYQNQSSVFFSRGNNITFNSHGYGNSNKNSQACQMWTMEVIYSQNLLLEDVFINHTSNNDKSDQNSDGADTLYSNNITFLRWYVENGDDSISAEQNSSNIFVEDSIFKRGLGVTLDSMGQYPGEYENVDGVYTRDQKGTPPNGGGGGIGVVQNIKFENFTFQNSKYIFAIGHCTTYSFNLGDCDSSTMAISNFSVDPITRSLGFEPPNARLQSSGPRPCPGIEVRDLDLTWDWHTAILFFNCSNVVDSVGSICNRTPPSGF